MPAPSSSLATLRPDLGGSLMEFDLAMNQQGFIASKVLPVIESAQQAGTYGRIPLEQLLQNRETRRAPSGGYSRSKWTFQPASFACEEHGAEEPIDDRQAQIYREYFDAELVATQRAYSAVLVNQERRVADLLFNPTTYSGSALYTDISTVWTDANAKPIDDINSATRKVYDSTGLLPNALVVNYWVYRTLRANAQIIDAIEASGAGNAAKAMDVTLQMLAQVFDLPYILVAGGSRNGANEGQAAAPQQIWSSSFAMVCRVAESNDISEPCVGRIVHWGEDGSSIGGTVETYRDESVRSNVVRVRHDVDELIQYTEAAHLLKID